MDNAKQIAWENVLSAFQKIWGYADFRPPQGEIVRALLQQQDALIVMPTGGGKSICFQLPALLQSGVTLVISPLVALMENQVQELRSRRLAAALLHSELASRQRQQTLQALASGQLRLLYLSPETLLSPPVWEKLLLPHLSINGLILDEAHCLVQWGETFRPTYRRLGAVRPALLAAKPAGTKIPIAAFTATADPAAQTTIRQVLQLQQPAVFLGSPYRPNLQLKVQTVWTPRGRRQRLRQFIQARKEQAGLVYARTRQDCEQLAQWLQEQGYATAAYHAGLTPSDRRTIEADWLSNKLLFVVCTSAFGMGVNKPDCRWIVHFQLPLLLSEYVQEVGRAGRDGKAAQALALASESTGWLDPTDKQRREFFARQLEGQYQKAQQLAVRLPQSGNVMAMNKQLPDSAAALGLLHSSGQLQWQDPFNFVRRSSAKQLSFRQLLQAQQQLQAQMVQYLKIKDCRWRYLLKAFGFAPESVNWRCDRCDNCDRHQ